MSNLPDKFWHCYVKLQGSRTYAVDNDLTLDQLRSRILTPWHQSTPFTVCGKLVTKDSKIEEIKVTRTPESQSVLASQFNAKQRANHVLDMRTDRHLLPIAQGQDFTNELLFAGKTNGAPEPDTEMVERLCCRLPNAARILLSRQRKNKSPFLIEDEYDVQDLLHALLRAYLKYSVQEDPLPKVAGTKSGRADISIEELGVLIEVKFVRSPEDQKSIFTDFSQDLVLYAENRMPVFAAKYQSMWLSTRLFS